MTIDAIVFGSRAESAKINNIIGALKGTAGKGDNILLTQYDSSTNPVLKIQPLDATNGKAIQILNSAGTETAILDKTSLWAKNGLRISVGDTNTNGNNWLTVYRTNTAQAVTLLDSVLTHTGVVVNSDVSAIRGVAIRSGSGDAQIRAGEFHTLLTSGAGTYGAHGIEISVQGSVAGVGGLTQNGLRIENLPTTWGIVGGVAMDNGCLVGYDESGFNYYYRAVGVSGSAYPELFSIDSAGVERIKSDVRPITNNTADLGTSSLIWRAIYGASHLAGNGSLTAPSLAGINFSTTGFCWPGSNALAVTTNGVNAARTTWDAVGNVVIGAAAIATNATDGFLYITSGAGAPTGVPTAYTGRCPLYVDTTNHKMYFYDASWVILN